MLWSTVDHLCVVGLTEWAFSRWQAAGGGRQAAPHLIPAVSSAQSRMLHSGSWYIHKQGLSTLSNIGGAREQRFPCVTCLPLRPGRPLGRGRSHQVADVNSKPSNLLRSRPVAPFRSSPPPPAAFGRPPPRRAALLPLPPQRLPRWRQAWRAACPAALERWWTKRRRLCGRGWMRGCCARPSRSCCR